MLGGTSCSKPSSGDSDSESDTSTPSGCLKWPIDDHHHIEFHRFTPLSNKHTSTHALPNYLTAIATIQADLWTDPLARPDAVLPCRDPNPDPGHFERNWWHFGSQVQLQMFKKDEGEECRLTYREAAKMFGALADFVRQHGVGELRWKLVREGEGSKEERVATVGFMRWWHYFDAVEGGDGKGNGTVGVA